MTTAKQSPFIQYIKIRERRRKRGASGCSQEAFPQQFKSAGYFVCLGGYTLLSACVLIRTVHGKFEEVVNSLRQLKAVKRVFTTLGRFDVVADLEAADLKELDRTVLRLGCIAGVVFSETLVEIHQ